MAQTIHLREKRRDPLSHNMARPHHLPLTVVDASYLFTHAVRPESAPTHHLPPSAHADLTLPQVILVNTTPPGLYWGSLLWHSFKHVPQTLMPRYTEFFKQLSDDLLWAVEELLELSPDDSVLKAEYDDLEALRPTCLGDAKEAYKVLPFLILQGFALGVRLRAAYPSDPDVASFVGAFTLHLAYPTSFPTTYTLTVTYQGTLRDASGNFLPWHITGGFHLGTSAVYVAGRARQEAIYLDSVRISTGYESRRHPLTGARAGTTCALFL